MLIFLTLIITLISFTEEFVLWAIIPVGILSDFLEQKPLGLSVLEMVIFSSLFRIVFGGVFRKKTKIRL